MLIIESGDSHGRFSTVVGANLKNGLRSQGYSKILNLSKYERIFNPSKSLRAWERVYSNFMQLELNYAVFFFSSRHLEKLVFLSLIATCIQMIENRTIAQLGSKHLHKMSLVIYLQVKFDPNWASGKIILIFMLLQSGTMANLTYIA